MAKSKKCFYAYPSQHPPTVFTIRNAITIINEAGYDVEVKPWEAMNVAGVSLLREIRIEIDDSDVFMCDLTQANMNVLFELGYAIVQNKRIWISRNDDLADKERLYQELGILSTIGYDTYTNSDELAWAFLNSAPFETTANAIYKEKIENQPKPLEAPRLLYLKSQILTQEAATLTRKIAKLTLPVVTDDPVETSSRSLEWYLEKLSNSFGIIAHFAEQSRDAQNAKYALICGMSYGLDLNLLMLAHAPYKPAIDYKDLMFVHQSVKQMTDRTDEWLIKAEDKFERLTYRNKQRRRRIDALKALERINLGEYEAESEEDLLKKYFVSTPAYSDALKTSRFMIFVGRKGSGKTANFYHLADELRSNSSNQVCVIKPATVHIEEIYELFTLSLSNAIRANLAESIWKFLIYTELARDCYVNLDAKPAPMYTPQEKEFVAYVKRTKFILYDFSQRLEYALRNLCKLNFSGILYEDRQQVSQTLHNEVLSQLRLHLGNILKDKEKVIILIDNLDKSWEIREDISNLIDFLFGLLEVGQVITDEFQQSSSRKQKVELAIILFIRSDIYTQILNQTKEKDKLHTLISWRDETLLLKVIEERFRSSLTGFETADEIWDTYFSPTVNEISTKRYLLKNILHKPRDIIFFCKQAYSYAINRDHMRIEEEDILKAQEDYSRHCFFTLEAETKVQIPEMPDLLIEFMGEAEIVTRERLSELIKTVGKPKKELDRIIDLLCEAQFLGLEVDLYEFVFVSDERLKHRRIQARKVAQKTGVERYKINTPFHAYLEIKPYVETSRSPSST